MTKVIEEGNAYLVVYLKHIFINNYEEKKIKVKLIKYRSKICNFINLIRIMRI